MTNPTRRGILGSGKSWAPSSSPGLATNLDDAQRMVESYTGDNFITVMPKNIPLMVKCSGNVRPGAYAYCRGDGVATTCRWSKRDGSRPRVGLFVSGNEDGWARVIETRNY